MRSTGDFILGVFAAFAVPYFMVRLASALGAGFGGWATSILLPAPTMYLYCGLWLRRRSFGNGVLAGTAVVVSAVVWFLYLWGEGMRRAL